MENLKLYYIDENYIDYLRKYDEKVLFNKEGKRPYVGVVLKFKGFNYYVPLSSPKSKHLKMNPYALDIFKIQNGKLGIININNMIPTPSEALKEIILSAENEKYKALLENQIIHINKNKKALLYKVSKYYELYNRNYLSSILKKRTCNFNLLEEKCLEYEQLLIKT